MDKDVEFTIIDPIDPAFIPATRPEDVAKHGEHDQKTHGNWASGNYDNLSEWFKDEDAVFGSEDDKQEYIDNTLMSQAEKGFTQEAYPQFAGAISRYETKIGYDLNEALRDDLISLEGYQMTIDALDKAIETAPALSEELVTYRGVKGNGLNFFEQLKVGDVYEDRAYTSTTIDPGVAQQFGGALPYYEGIVFRFKLPAGTKGIFPAGYKTESVLYGGEAEFLLPRGSKFKVVAQRGKVWDVELVP